MHGPGKPVPDDLRKAFQQKACDRLGGAGAEERSAGSSEALTDCHNLLGCLPLAKHDLGVALPERPMMINPGECDVFEREVTEAFERGPWSHAAGGHLS